MAGSLADPDEDRTPYEKGGNGAGGKMRSGRSTRGARSSAVRISIPTPTPYERPSVGLHTSAGLDAAAHLSRVSASAGQSSWLGGRIVSSASRILTNGAMYLFSSVFSRHRIENKSNNPTNVPTTGEDLKLGIPNGPIEADGLSLEKEVSPQNDSDADARECSQFKEIDIFLKQSTFTREQCNYFIDVLKGKVQEKAKLEESDEAGTEDEMRKPGEQPNCPLATVDAVPEGSTFYPDLERWSEERWRYRDEHAVGGMIRKFGHKLSSDCLSTEDVKLPSPRDLAKKYMDNHFSRATALTLLPRSPRKDESTSDHRSHLATRNPNREDMVGGGPSRRFLSSEEDALQSVTRAYRLPSAYLSKNSQQQGEMSKRRSVFLEDIGTPCRTRIRTSSMAPHSFLTLENVPGTRLSSNPSEPPVTALAPPSSRSTVAFDRGNTSNANRIMDAERDEMNEQAFVPMQSSRIARTILETLERISPPPKGRSLDRELASPQGMPSTRLFASLHNKGTSRMMQTAGLIGPPPDSLEATEVEYSRPSVEEILPHPSKFSTQANKLKEYCEGPRGKEYCEGPRGSKPHAMPSFCHAGTNEAIGLELETKRPQFGVTHALGSFSKAVDIPVSKHSKSKGSPISAFFEELLSEGMDRSQALTSDVSREKSEALVACDANTSSASSTRITFDNVPIPTVPSTTASTMTSSNSLGATVSPCVTSPNPVSGFSFPLPPYAGADMEPPPTPKPMPLPFPQSDKSISIPQSTTASLQQDSSLSSPLSAPFQNSSRSSTGKFAAKKRSLFSTPLSTLQVQFSLNPAINFSNFTAPASASYQPNAAIQTASAIVPSPFISNTFPSRGQSSFIPGSISGSPFAASSFSSSGESSSVFTSGLLHSTTTSATAIACSSTIVRTASSVLAPSTSSASASSSTITPVFTDLSTGATRSSSEKQVSFGCAGFGQGSDLLNAQPSSSTPVAGDTVSVPFPLESSASSSSLTFSTSTTISSGFGTSSFSFGSTLPPRSATFGAASSSPFGLMNAAPTFGGGTTFSIAASGVPAFGTVTIRPFGISVQDAGSSSSPADTTLGSSSIPTPASVGFGNTQTASSKPSSLLLGPTDASTLSSGLIFGSSITETQGPHILGGTNASTFWQASGFGSASTKPTSGTPPSSVTSNDSNEQTIIEEKWPKGTKRNGPS